MTQLRHRELCLYVLLFPSTHSADILVVVEIIGSIGAEDAATTFLLPRHCDVFNRFQVAVREWHDDDARVPRERPKWPTEVCSMAAVKTLYSVDVHAVPLVVAFGNMVHAKVQRIASFYQRATEATVGITLDPDAPADDIEQQGRNPLVSGGIYYKNGGSPIASLRPSLADAGASRYGRSVDVASDQHDCKKVVRLLLLPGVIWPQAKADFRAHISSFPAFLG